MSRKRHVDVPQERFLEVLQEVGDAPLDHVAEYLNVSESTARRKLDGLVVQGKLSVYSGRHGYPRHYFAV